MIDVYCKDKQPTEPTSSFLIMLANKEFIKRNQKVVDDDIINSIFPKIGATGREDAKD